MVRKAVAVVYQSVDEINHVALGENVELVDVRSSPGKKALLFPCFSFAFFRPIFFALCVSSTE